MGSYDGDRRHPQLREKYGPYRPQKGPTPPPLFSPAPRGLSNLCFTIAVITGIIAFLLYGENNPSWETAAIIAGVAGLFGGAL